MQLSALWRWLAPPIWAGLLALLVAGRTSWWGLVAAFLLGATLASTIAVRLCRFKLDRALDHAQAAKAEAEQANSAKSKFLAAASHDLRQPVQSLALFMAVLEQRVAGTPLAQLAGQMAYAVETLNSLLTSLLDISRLDAGIIVPRLESLPVHDLVDHLTQEYAVQAGAKGLRLVTRIEPAFAVTDLTLLERMIRNLLENAVRYTQEGGILLRLRPHQGRVRLDVVDSGIGISPEQRSAIFDEFFQVANASRDRSQGLGLGLSIVARLCTLIGGEIAVASRVGRGTRFTVWLPAANAPPIKVPSLAAAQTCAGE